jgi:hypothetical protein
MRELRVAFADEGLLGAFNKLAAGTFEERQLYASIQKALGDLKKDSRCGVQVPRKLIPAFYLKKYGVPNLWKYNLPNAWRLLYTVYTSESSIMSVIVEWLSHPDYEQRFGYKNK